MSDNYTLVRYQYEGDKFEILVDPDKGLLYKRGELAEVSIALLIDTIFTDAGKGEKASSSKLESVFGTDDPREVAVQIFEKGTFLLTASQRKEMLDQKRRQIVNLISRTYVDPSTKLPHPPLRVENAMEEVNVAIDPFRPADQQVQEIVKALRHILPMSSEGVEIAIKIPPEYTGKSYGIVKDFSQIKREEWQSDGSWIAVIVVPAARHLDLLNQLGKATQGNLQSKILK
jgi:ribosome maturation protein SDO1